MMFQILTWHFIGPSDLAGCQFRVIDVTLRAGATITQAEEIAVWLGLLLWLWLLLRAVGPLRGLIAASTGVAIGHVAIASIVAIPVVALGVIRISLVCLS